MIKDKRAKKKRILYAYLYCNKGGVTSVIKQRIPILKEAGWETYAIFKHDNGGREELLEAGMVDVQIHTSTFLENVQLMLTTHHIDLCIVFDTPELIPTIKENYDIPVIYAIHTSIERNIRNNRVKELIKCEAIFVPSKWSKNKVLQLFPQLGEDLIIVVPNLVSQSIFTPHGEMFEMESPTLLWVGKFTPEKRWEEALEISTEFLLQHLDWQLVWTTGGEYKDVKVKRVLDNLEKNNLTTRFKWFHNLNHAEMGKLYRGVATSGGFLLSSSINESFCLIMHEAMRCGLPLLAAEVGPIPDVITHMETGLLYQPGDTKTALKLCDLYVNNPELRNTILENIPSALEPFNYDKIKSVYVEALNFQ